jgi:hypothetical protein
MTEQHKYDVDDRVLLHDYPGVWIVTEVTRQKRVSYLALPEEGGPWEMEVRERDIAGLA